MRSINFKGGLTRVWIVFSYLYGVFALAVLVAERNCFLNDDFLWSQCSNVFIWQSGTGESYANIATMVATLFGGYALLWGSLYALLGIGRGLRWILCWVKDGLCWVKDGFFEESTATPNEVKLSTHNKQGEVDNEIDSSPVLIEKQSTRKVDIEVGAEPLLVKLPDTNKLDEEPDLILGEATDTSTKLNEVKKRNTLMWVVKSIFMTLVSFVVAAMIPSIITTYVIPIKTISRTFLSLVIWSASFFPIWQSDRELKQRLVAWLLGASAGGIAYLSYKAICRSLYSSGTLDIDMTSKLTGLSPMLGWAVALSISYLVNNRGRNENIKGGNE
jgi:hypothetical protein